MNKDLLASGISLLNEKEAAAILGISVYTLQKWRYLGKNLEYLKIGRLIKYDSKSLADFIEQTKVIPVR